MKLSEPRLYMSGVVKPWLYKSVEKILRFPIWSTFPWFKDYRFNRIDYDRLASDKSFMKEFDKAFPNDNSVQPQGNFYREKK